MHEPPQHPAFPDAGPDRHDSWDQGALGMPCRSSGFSATTKILWSAIVLQVVCGGVRFVDGSMLLQFSQAGFQANLKDFSQYLFDSPLKILFLRAIHLDSASAIGALFLALNFLPLITILFVSRDRLERQYLLAIVSIVPIWKLMFQNIGVGDSIVISGTIVLVVARHWLSLASAAFLMVLWHFQQGILMVSFVFVLCSAMPGPGRSIRLRALAAGAMVGICSFVAIKTFLVPPHTSRLEFIFAHMAPFLSKNVLYLPIALCAIVPGTILMAELLQEPHWKERKPLAVVAITATALAVFVGSITTDFSRVMVLLTFPIILFIANPRTEPPEFREKLLTPRHLVPLAAIAVVTPFFSWSGIDVFLWTSLIETFRKYLPGAV
jgi:hypothetical protein